MACDVEKEKLFSACRDEELVDARHILIRLLHDAGAYPSMIASALNLTPRAVTHALSHFDGRIASKKWMRNCYEKAQRELGNN